MSALIKLVSGFDTQAEWDAWIERLNRVRTSLEEVPVGIFTAGVELKTVLQLAGTETRTNGRADFGIDPDHLTRVENRVAEFKAKDKK